MGSLEAGIFKRAIFTNNHRYSSIIKRNLFEWLNIVWNRVDKKRIEEIGPDMACAEWLMRNGASVKWSRESSFIPNFNSPKETTETHFIEEVEGNDSSITYMGFPYFDGCKHIKRIKFYNCTYLDDQAMKNMRYVQNTLQHLEIYKNGNITDTGITSLGILSKLNSLILSELPAVKNPDECSKKLQTLLPNCNVSWR